MKNILRGGIFLSILSLSLSACDALKPAQNGDVKTKKPTDYTVQNPPKTTQSKVDTVYWRTDPTVPPPITNTTVPSKPTDVVPPLDNNTNNTNSNNSTTTTTKGRVEMALLLPFFSDNFVETASSTPSKSQFALDYYAGVKLALDTLSTLSLNLNVSVIDSKSSFNSLISRYEVSRADVLMGPIEKENVLAAMNYATQNGKTFISPYFPSSDLTSSNPNFVQVKPSLKTHCENIVRHVRSQSGDKNVVLVGLTGEVSRFEYFQEATKLYGGSRIDEYKIEDETNYNIEPYIEATGTTVFIVPSWNENFVAGFLRKLAASPRKNQVMVYGMPQWMDFPKTVQNSFESLRVRVSSSTFIDANSPEVKQFKARFQSKYGKQPNSDAFLGYDVMLYFGKMMMNYGSKFTFGLDREAASVLHTQFAFAPIYRPQIDDTGNNIAKYENKYVNILKYTGGTFKLD